MARAQHDYQTLGSLRWSDDGILIAERLRGVIAEQAHELMIDGVEPGRHRIDPLTEAFADEGLELA